ncbi:mucin-2-like [Saccostrea cucullata]|uniref:mucin-2-like n=1 Tax=Saccostrea cuccullata TaxID=36930 RepID=UPI002ED06A58
MISRVTRFDITPVGVRLKILPSTNDLQLNKEETISYQLTNTGNVETNFEVNITDDKGFLVSSNSTTIHLQAGETVVNTINLNGTDSGSTVKVQLTVFLWNSTEVLQMESKKYYISDVQRLECKITDQSPQCPEESLTTKTCDDYRWSGSTEISFTLIKPSQIVASNNDVNIQYENITNTNNSMNVNISGHCCVQSVQLNAYDDDGFFAKCDFVFSNGTIVAVEPETTTEITSINTEQITTENLATTTVFVDTTLTDSTTDEQTTAVTTEEDITTEKETTIMNQKTTAEKSTITDKVTADQATFVETTTVSITTGAGITVQSTAFEESTATTFQQKTTEDEDKPTTQLSTTTKELTTTIKVETSTEIISSDSTNEGSTKTTEKDTSTSPSTTTEELFSTKKSAETTVLSESTQTYMETTPTSKYNSDELESSPIFLSIISGTGIVILIVAIVFSVTLYKSCSKSKAAKRPLPYVMNHAENVSPKQTSPTDNDGSLKNLPTAFSNVDNWHRKDL